MLGRTANLTLSKSSSYLPTDRNLTVGNSSDSNIDSASSNSNTGKASGRVDEQIGNNSY
ncbi:MAG: hypothetical protein JO297_17285 [Nitrososphaeraceae archaeon]|nr:hypothetical protein [Nitrososphaeraceae archaeon]